MELSTSTILAIIGLSLAILELYFPTLSIALEHSLDQAVLRLTPVYRGMGGASRQIHDWLSGTRVGRFYSKYYFGLLFFYTFPLFGIILVFEAQIEASRGWITDGALILFGFPAALILFLAIPLSIYMYLYPVFFLISKLVSFPIYVMMKMIWFANFLGRGKGLSGIGITMAFYEVLGGIW